MPKTVCRCGGIKDDNGCSRCGVKVDDRRESACKRGYDRRWRKFAAIYKQHNPLCIDCLDSDRVTPVAEIHHVKKLADHPELKYDESNLMPLCRECHSIRTARGE